RESVGGFETKFTVFAMASGGAETCGSAFADFTRDAGQATVCVHCDSRADIIMNEGILFAAKSKITSVGTVSSLPGVSAVSTISSVAVYGTGTSPTTHSAVTAAATIST